MLHTFKEPFLTLNDVVIAIGNYNNETKKLLEALTARLGPMGFDVDRPKKDDSPKPECKGCGRSHDGECSLKGHPNFNKGPEPWAESKFGKAFAALKGKDAWSKLPEKSMLSSDLKTLVPYKRFLN